MREANGSFRVLSCTWSHLNAVSVSLTTASIAIALLSSPSFVVLPGAACFQWTQPSAKLCFHLGSRRTRCTSPAGPVKYLYVCRGESRCHASIPACAFATPQQWSATFHALLPPLRCEGLSLGLPRSPSCSSVYLPAPKVQMFGKRRLKKCGHLILSLG